MTQISDMRAKTRAPKAFFVGLAVAGVAAVSVVPAAGALPVDTGAELPDYSQSTNVSADLAGSLGLGLAGTSLLQGGDVMGGTTSAAGAMLNTAGGLDVNSATATKDGETSTSTKVGADANVGAALNAMTDTKTAEGTATSATDAGATAGLSVGAEVDASAKTDTNTGSLGGDLLNGGLLNGSLLNL
jgi:hypothetical protein